jgi:hypothetical protein
MARYRVEIVDTTNNVIVEIYETSKGTPAEAWERAMDWITDRQLATTEQATIITLEI